MGSFWRIGDAVAPMLDLVWFTSAYGTGYGLWAMGGL